MTKTPARITLAPQHKKFADKYLQTGHISKSARHAGYADGSAHVSGNRLLKRPDVQQYLRERGTQLSQETEDLSSRVIREYEAIAFANIADFITVGDDGLPEVDFSNATDEQLRAIASVATKRRRITDKDGNVTEEVEAKFNMNDKLRGLEGLGKHLGLFKAEEQRVVVDVADRLLLARQRLQRAQLEAPE